MLQSKRYLFHHVVIAADSFGRQDFWTLWKRPLDPYQTLLRDTPADLVLNNSFGKRRTAGLRSVLTRELGLFQMETYADRNGETLWEYRWAKDRDTCVLFEMSSGYDEIRLISDESGTGGVLSFELLGYLIPYVMLKHDSVTFHGVLMEHEGRGIILSAPSGVGKTTHARLWRDCKRALILNGDRATCCVENGKWVGFSLPWSGTSGECINRDVPLTAFVALEQAKENCVEQLDGLDAFGAVIPNLICPAWDRALTEKALDYINDFIEQIPVFRLRCRPDVESVEVLDRALREL